jgi:hypothetical protein
MTPLIAPDAPTIGVTDAGSESTWAMAAASPQIR